MAKEKGATLRFVYGIFLSLWSVFVGVLFIMQVWSIYRSAPQSPYTVESITSHFHQIAIPVWLWLAFIVGNILLSIAFPEKETRPKAYIDTAFALSKAKNSFKADEELSKKTQATARKQKIFRAAVNAVCAAILIFAAVACLATMLGWAYYPLIKTEFFTAHNGVADKLVQCVALAALALAVACVGAALNANSRKKERVVYLQAKVEAMQAKRTEEKKPSRWTKIVDCVVNAVAGGRKATKKELDTEVQKALAEPQKTLPKKRVKAEKKERKVSPKSKMAGVWSLRAVLFAAAAVLLIVGVQNGGMREMFLKAINICTQCIGLG